MAKTRTPPKEVRSEEELADALTDPSVDIITATYVSDKDLQTLRGTMLRVLQKNAKGLKLNG